MQDSQDKDADKFSKLHSYIDIIYTPFQSMPVNTAYPRFTRECRLTYQTWGIPNKSPSRLQEQLSQVCHLANVALAMAGSC